MTENIIVVLPVYKIFCFFFQKAKSMQPSNFDDVVANSAERCINKRKRQFVDRLQSSDNTPQNSPNLGRILVQETQPRTPVSKICCKTVGFFYFP
jgi:hypothetical protein